MERLTLVFLLGIFIIIIFALTTYSFQLRPSKPKSVRKLVIDKSVQQINRRPYYFLISSDGFNVKVNYSDFAAVNLLDNNKDFYTGFWKR